MRFGLDKIYQNCIVSIVLLGAFCILTGKTLSYWYAPVSIIGEEEKLTKIHTTSSYRYPSLFQETLHNDDYSEFRNLYVPSLSSAIPGLDSTDVLGTLCESMVPQGICIAEEYMLISAYDKKKDNQSVLYVLSNDDPAKREYLTTIVLPDINHVGGLAYDGEYVWVAKSTTKTCSAIAFSEIKEAVLKEQSSVSLDKYTATVSCGSTASFLTFYDDRLWIGTFAGANKGHGMISSFRISGSGEELTLTKVNTLPIPTYANGVMIEEVDGRTYMAIVASYSRKSDTNVYLYELFHDDSEWISTENLKIFRFPPMGEEIVSDGENAYFLFESAASCYSEATNAKNRCDSPVDRVCAISLDKMILHSEVISGDEAFAEAEDNWFSLLRYDAILPQDTQKMIERLKMPRIVSKTKSLRGQTQIAFNDNQILLTVVRKVARSGTYKYPDFYFASYRKC